MLFADRQFRTILAQCYYSQGDRDNYFVFELTKNEAKGLISKFETNSINAPQRSAPAPQRLPAPSQVRQEEEKESASPLLATLSCLLTGLPQMRGGSVFDLKRWLRMKITWTARVASWTEE